MMKLLSIILGITFSVSITVLILSSVNNPQAEAQSVSDYIVYEESSNSCSQNSNTINLNEQELEQYDQGIGVERGTQTIYKPVSGSPLFGCCLEQVGLNGGEVENCEGLPLSNANDEAIQPWISASNGNTYAKLHNLRVGNPTSGFFTTRPWDARLAEFTFITDRPASDYSGQETSYNGLSLFDYASSSALPPALSGFDTWYGYKRRLAQVNVGGFSETTAPSNLSGSLASVFPPDSENVVYTATDGVTIASGTVCNTRALIFVPGDLTINPSFTIANKNLTVSEDVVLGQGCLFVVGGDVIVTAGDTGQNINTGTNSDLLEIGVFAAGELRIDNDDDEPLRVLGFLSGGYGNIQRASGSEDHPSLWTELDNRYAEVFKEELKIDRFATRERGYTSTGF